MDRAKLVEKLRATAPTTGHMKAMGSTSLRINPDGLEAAVLIEADGKRIEELEAALEAREKADADRAEMWIKRLRREQAEAAEIREVARGSSQ